MLAELRNGRDQMLDGTGRAPCGPMRFYAHLYEQEMH